METIMKNILSIAVICLLCLAGSGPASAQQEGADKPKKERKKRSKAGKPPANVPKIDSITLEGLPVEKAGGDWLCYMGNESRSGVSLQGVTTGAAPSWTFSMSPPVPGFKPVFGDVMGQQKGNPEFCSRFDFASAMVISGEKAYFGASTEESLYCVNVSDGKIQWVHRSEGAVRLSPTILGDKIYFGSDDGKVYCLDKNTGKELWTFSASPTDRRIVANGRLAAQCPVRTSITAYKGRVHFAAGLFPNSGGVHLYGVDAETGKQNWKTSLLTSAQGYVLAEEGKLFVPTGRTSPTEYDAATGESLTLTKVVPRMDGGGSAFVRSIYDMLVFGPTEKGALRIRVTQDPKAQSFEKFRPITGAMTVLEGVRLMVDDKRFYLLDEGTITAMPNGSLIESLKQSAADFKNRKGSNPSFPISGKGSYGVGDKIIQAQIQTYKTWEAKVPDAVNMIIAGNKMYAGAKDKVYVIDLKDGAVTSRVVEGTAWELSAGANSLFVSTDVGKIYRFGDAADNLQITTQTKSPIPVSPKMETYAKDAAEKADTAKGYCVVLGGVDGSLGYALSRLTEMQIVYFMKDAESAAAMKKIFVNTGLYGKNVTVRLIEGDTIPYINYFANLIVSEKGFTHDEIGFSAKEVYKILQPNGGAIVLGGAAAGLAGAWKRDIPELTPQGAYAVATRGDLPLAGNWTHMWANPQNTSASGDDLVKGHEFNMQWFGYPYPNGRTTGWHFLSLASLYNKGVLLVIYTDYMVAVDAWNGTILWEKDIQGAVRYSPTRESGNCCMDDMYFYVTIDRECRVVDLKNGKDVKTITLPNPGDWGFIASYKKYLIGSSQDPKASNKVAKAPTERMFWYTTEGTFVTSDSLTIKNKEDFSDVWTYSNPGHSIVNSTITVAEDKIFFVETALKTGAHTLPTVKKNSPKLVAINIKDKSPVWGKKDVTIAMQNLLFLGYSDNHLYLTGNTIASKGKSRSSYHYQKIDAKNGALVWSNDKAAFGGKGYSHNFIIVNPVILKDYIWCIPPSGPNTKISTQDGTSTQLKVKGRGKGCSMVSASNHLALYRSNSIGYTDFNDGTTGFASQVNRPACFMGLIPAGGMLLMPEGSLGCVCGFPYQGSVVLTPKEKMD